MRDDKYFEQRDPKNSLDFGELDELLDDINCRNVTLNFDRKHKLTYMSFYCDGGINAHMMYKIQKLYNLDIINIDPYDEESIKIGCQYSGDYFNKAEHRKEEWNNSLNKS